LPAAAPPERFLRPADGTQLPPDEPAIAMSLSEKALMSQPS